MGPPSVAMRRPARVPAAKRSQLSVSSGCRRLPARVSVQKGRAAAVPELPLAAISPFSLEAMQRGQSDSVDASTSSEAVDPLGDPQPCMAWADSVPGSASGPWSRSLVRPRRPSALLRLSQEHTEPRLFGNRFRRGRVRDSFPRLSGDPPNKRSVSFGQHARSPFRLDTAAWAQKRPSRPRPRPTCHRPSCGAVPRCGPARGSASRGRLPGTGSRAGTDGSVPKSLPAPLSSTWKPRAPAGPRRPAHTHILLQGRDRRGVR
jgi:hypothetical protein